MRTSRKIKATTILATIVASMLLAAPAWADSGITDGSSSSSTASPTESSAKPVTETTTPKPSTDTTTKPTTSTTTTTKPTTDTSTSVCTSSSSSNACGPTTTPTTPTVPEEPEVPGPETPIEETPTVDTPTEDAPGGGGELPFTGPGDVLLAIVLALLAGSAGILFLAGAAGRAQLDGLNPRGMDSPSGFKLAYRELLKQQVD